MKKFLAFILAFIFAFANVGIAFSNEATVYSNSLNPHIVEQVPTYDS